jgi:tetratricopeptide (TPR) repeat protein
MAEARTLLKHAPDLRAEAQLRFIEGDIAQRQERLSESLVALRESAQLASQANADHLRARALTSLSFSCQSRGMVEEATAALREARDIFEERGDVLAQCHALRLLAWYCVDEQRAEHARAANHELLALGQRHAIGWARGISLLLAGHLELDAGHLVPATLAYEQAILALTRDEITPLIAAATLYLSLTLEARHEWEPARARFQEAYALLPLLRSPWARAYLRCVRAVWAGRDRDLALAERLIDEARAEQEGSDSIFYVPMLTLYTCSLDMLRWEQAQRAGKARQENQCLRQLLERMGSFMQTARPILGRSLELRVALRHIQQRLPAWLRARMALELDDPSATSLLLDSQELAYRAPGQDAWVDMSKRPTPMRLLLALATHHAAAPGQPMSADTLCEHVWPGERIMPEAATNRLYVTISGLRRDGLRDVILNVEGGYLINPSLKLRAV